MKDEIFKYTRELRRALANFRFEITENGDFYFGGSQALVGGSVVHTLNGADRRVDHNTWTIEGLNYLLTTGLKNGSPYAAMYLAPFSGNVTPASTLTAATFTSTLTEATAYSESTRQAWTGGSVASGSVDNTASMAQITANASVNIWGAGMLSNSTKSATTGVCIAATKFSSVRALSDTDVLAFGYTMSITPA
jgi:hypothetical protein